MNDTLTPERSILGSKVFDQTMGFLHKNPDATHGKPSTLRTLTPVKEEPQTFIVQTVRLRDQDGDFKGDYVFIEFVGSEGALRLVLPPDVTACIARQREAVSSRVRKASAKQEAIRRKQAGIVPAFLRNGHARPKRKRAKKAKGGAA